MPSGEPKPKVGIVDDDPAVRSRLTTALQVDFEVLEGKDYPDAYRLLKENELDVLILDLLMPPEGVRECAELLRQLDGSEIDTLVIVLSDDAKRSTALKVIDAGSYDYFIKPIDPEILKGLLARAVEKLHLQRENRILREEIHRKHTLGDLIGATETMSHVFASIKRVARANTTVVIRGESGTGKELVARAIHFQGPRRSHPFVSVNCAALPEGLMEAELFGYERGAFTGAVETKEGRIELAHHGSLFLDEIATLTPGLQSKLLRVLEEHVLVRLGGKKPIRVDFRLITATNENLEEAVRQGRFREDLYYRIHVVPIFVPPLRERVEDIPTLVDYFLSVYCAANQFRPKRVDDNALAALKRYSWPGNVRELENAVQRLVLMTDDDLIKLQDLPQDIVQASGHREKSRFHLPASGFQLEKEMEAHERRWVETALAQADGVKTEAARLLGLNKDKMKYLCRKYDL